jgi:superfamily II DNA or RNA helicase
MRLFNSAQKRHLFVMCGGRCQRCGGVLGESWDAHHVKRHADGGVTELTNVMALCRPCHVAIHRKLTMVITPRGWQKSAIQTFISKLGSSVSFQATPGAGKTILSALCARELLLPSADGSPSKADFAIIVVPTTALKGSDDAGFLGDWNKCGLDLTTNLKNKGGCPSDFHGAVVTYQQLSGLVENLAVWKSNGTRIFAVFDEVHHASEDNQWGADSEALARLSVGILSMTGTPFRGDRRRISFLRYNNDGVVIADHSYSYRQAVADKVCRQVTFMHDDGVAQYILNDNEYSVTISETDDTNAGYASGAIFKKDSRWLTECLQKADEQLTLYRHSDADAGGIIVCRPGGGDGGENADSDEQRDRENRYINQVAKMMFEITGEFPAVITHDDLGANTKIDQFRAGRTRWLCSVRKVSEGVDIKRLRVLVLASRPTTELLFRQLVGRVVRYEDQTKREDATVFMARFPQLVEWANRIAAEAEAGIRELDERESADSQRPDQGGKNRYIPINATHMDGGATSAFGDFFSAEEVMAAEKIKKLKSLYADIPITTLAEIMRDLGHTPTADEVAQEPLHTQKKRMRQEINALVTQIAKVLDPKQPNYPGVWKALHQKFGVRGIDDLMDNHPIEKMRQVKDFLVDYLRMKTAA